MTNFQNSKKHRLIKLTLVIISGLILLLFSSFQKEIDNGFINYSNLIIGGKEIEPAIVILEISAGDIEKLGGWPLKRNYYALLLNELSKLNTAAIGIEVFLADNLSFQTIYNDLLIDQIEENGNVVLGALAEGVIEGDNYFSAYSIKMPMNIEGNEIRTGHLNFATGEGVIIPSEIYGPDRTEKSFSTVIYELYTGKRFKERNLRVNFYNSYKEFKCFSVLEFFNKLENGDDQLQYFEDKVVLIGVTDPAISKSISTGFDDFLPGVALHAFALDNQLTGRYVNDHSKFISSLILFFLVLIFSVQPIRKPVRAYLLIWLLLLFFSFTVFISFNIDIGASCFILPLLFLTAAEVGINFYRSKKEVHQTLSEKTLLLDNLYEKEKELERLKKNASDTKASGTLLHRINELENEINKLKVVDEEDKQIADLSLDKTKLFEGIVYRSIAMQNVVNVVKKVAPENATVLILGESGSGKELIARALHNLSPRKNENFVAVNCAALSDSLLESELFGHVKGAFTSAVEDKKGMFEAADKGTIFLDEIGETSENFQVKLLRILQTGELQKVGSVETKHVDVRIVAATNKILSKMVEEKKFREDLFYRLNVINIELPPLRERKDDIGIIAEYFVKKEDPQLNISQAALKILEEQKWKGNIRELESVIKRAVIFAKAEDRRIIRLSDLPEEIGAIKNSDLESMILNSLREKKFSRSSINQTAKELGNLSRTVVSENFRGLCLKNFISAAFDFEKTVEIISASKDREILNRVSSKLQIYLSNIEDDVRNSNNNFEDVKTELNSKYKNLPQKYHLFLDEIIKYYLSKKPGNN